MILDNENENLKVHDWISSYTEQGKLDIVTGYFTIGAVAWLSKTVNDKISDFRLVLGDIVNVDSIDNRPLDLLNENISIEASLKLCGLSKEAVKFLKQDKVVAKTLEPNFCHAKSYLFNPKKKDDRNKYFISGSSNLTEAGIGLKRTNNIELNIAETGNNNQYKELVDWFDALWVRPQAHKEKTLVAPDGTKTKIDFKQYLINEIEKIFIKYTPRELYYKVLFELFGNQLLETENDPDFNRQIGRLENSVVYNTLYEFQKKGVLSLIRMLQKYNGAILADAVGLGKTWSALAVIKFFQLQETGLTFPAKTKPVNLFVTPSQLGNFESFEELFDHFPPMLSGYQPSFYLEVEDEEEKDVLHDERQRDRFLVKMMYILMVKRLESSWYSFYSTVEKIKDHHQNALDRIKAYQEGKANSKLNEKDENLFDDDDLQDDYEELTLGKKRKINLSDITSWLWFQVPVLKRVIRMKKLRILNPYWSVLLLIQSFSWKRNGIS